MRKDRCDRFKFGSLSQNVLYLHLSNPAQAFCSNSAVRENDLVLQENTGLFKPKWKAHMSIIDAQAAVKRLKRPADSFLCICSISCRENAATLWPCKSGCLDTQRKVCAPRVYLSYNCNYAAVSAIRKPKILYCSFLEKTSFFISVICLFPDHFVFLFFDT